MAGWKHFSEIVAWQLARELKRHIYVLLRRPEFKNDRDLSGQLRRAARSAPGNIAEGFGRFGNKEFANFTRIAKGSEVELINHLIDARDQGLLSQSEFDQLQYLACRAIKASAGLIRHLESTKQPPRPKTNDTKI